MTLPSPDLHRPASGTSPAGRSRPFLVAGLLGIATLALLALVLAGLVRLDALTARAFSNLKETALWPASQVTIELTEFLILLDDFEEGRKGVGLDGVVEKFEILVSRRVVYDSGELGRLVQSHPASRRTVGEIGAALDAIEPLLAGLQPGETTTVDRIREIARPILPQARSLMVSGLMADIAEYDRNRDQYLANRGQFQFVGALAVAALLALVIYLALTTFGVRRLLSRTEKIGSMLEDVLESMSDGLIVWDRNLRLVMANRRWRELFPAQADLAIPGTARADLDAARRGHLASLGLAETPEARSYYDSPVAEEAGPLVVSLVDTGRSIVVSNRRMRDGSIVGIRSDITELVERERDLAAARQRLITVIENISEGFLLWGPDLRLVLVNRVASGFYPGTGSPFQIGARLDEAIATIAAGMSARPVAPARISRRAARWMARLTAGGSAEFRLPDGRWLLVTTSRLEDGSLSAVAADVTLLRQRTLEAREAGRRLAGQADEMRRLADTAQRASRAKSAFLAAMSHEIRTPMNAVVGFSQILAESDLGPTERRYVEIVDRSARHLVAIIDDILDFSGLEAGKLELEPAPFELRRLLDDVVDMGRVLARSKSLKLELSVDPVVPERVVGDARRVTQVLVNLVSNAVKFTKRGSVRIEARRVDAGAARPRIVFAVSDTGPGLPAGADGWLFEPFERGSAAGAAREAGTGLGLAISKRLVGVMGGTIRHASVSGGGTRFEVEVPFDLPTPLAERAVSDAGSAMPAEPLDILVAEDTPASQMLIQLMLEARGHRVQCVDDGVAAVEAAANRAFDIIILDLRMPRMDGVAAARAIRTLPGPIGQAPILALTAEIDPVERQAAAAAGMSGYLTKPFRASNLDAALAAAAEQIRENRVQGADSVP